MIEPNHFEVPPWKNCDLWYQAVHSLEHVTEKRWRRLWQARRVADLIENKLRGVDGALETLCDSTCKSCADICCKKATVWYDFKDLLYIHLASGSLPAAQIHKEPDFSCGKLTPVGCELPRIRRPFICTWYICPDQADFCGGQQLQATHDIQTSILEIQTLRKQLEHEYVQAVLPE